MSEFSSSRGLRRACQNCNNAKRKCTIQLPSCARCVKRKLTCTYDLEPLAQLQDHTASESTTPEPGDDPDLHCFLTAAAVGGKTNMLTVHVNITKWSNLHHLISALERSLDLASKNRVSTFLHPKLQFIGSRNYLSNAGALIKTPDNEHIQELLRIDIDECSLSEALTAIHALILYLIAHLYSTESAIYTAAEPRLRLLHHWAQSLFTMAPSRIPPDLTPWQSWLLGETTRRTLIMAHVLLWAYTGWRHGYCQHSLCVESLPFDKRVGLWQAESPQAWIAAARVKRGKEVGTQLASLHEFAVSTGEEVDLEGDGFFALALGVHSGWKRANAEKKRVC